MLHTTPKFVFIGLGSLGLLLAVGAAPGQAQNFTVTTRQPRANVHNAARATDVSITFSQPPAAATAQRLAVYGTQAGGRKAGSYATAGPTVSFNPAQDFKPGEKVWVSVPATLLSTTGNGAAPQVFQFTAAAEGTGRGNYQPGTDLPTTDAADVALGDIDGDGDLDLLSSNRSGGHVLVRLNGGDATGSNTGQFSGSQTVAVGPGPTRLRLADVDGDGDLDLLVCSTNGSRVSLRLNGGDATGSNTGQFSGGQEIIVGSAPAALAVGDVDADGDLDLLVLRSVGYVDVRLNGGDASGSNTGQFSGNQQVSFSGSAPTDLALGDIDADGDLDLLIAVGSHPWLGSSAVVTCLNGTTGTSTGTFTYATATAVGAQPTSIALGDINGDNTLDLLTASSSQVSVRPNVGLGVFTGSIDLSLSSTPAQLALADVDADGDLDLVTTHLIPGSGPGQAQVHLNGSNGFFTTTYSTAVGAAPGPLALGDIDGDGDLDLTTATSSSVAVRLNQPPPPSITGFSPSSAVAGETVTLTGANLTGATLTVGGQPATVLSNSATSLTFTVPAGAAPTAPTVASNSLGSGSSSAFTVLFKVTGSSPAANALNVPRAGSAVQLTFTEALAAATASNVRVFSAQAGGRKAGTATASGNTLRFAATAGTPYTDFRPGEEVSVSVPAGVRSVGGIGATGPVVRFTAAAGGTGRANFQAGSDPLVADRPYAVLAADVDGDGDLDLVTANYGTGTGNTVGILPNDGAGNFGLFGTFAVYGTTSGVVAVAAGDVDADGDIDLVSANANTSNVTVLLNDGTGNFGFGNSFYVGGSPRRVRLADLDGDGDLDLLTANTGNGRGTTVSLRLNNGTGLFSGTTDLILGNGVTDVVAADLDRDGDLDLLASVATTNSVAVRFNNGAGTFSGAGSVAVGSSPSSVAAADVDGDGDLDLLATNSGSNSVSVRLNDGTGSFSGGADVAVGSRPSDLRLADVDADGDLDLLTSHAGSNTVAVRLNDGTGTFGGGSDPLVDTATFNGAGALSLTTADLDGDGDIDLVTANSGNASGNTVSVRLNQPAAPALLSFTPGSGGPGTVVTLTGSGFTGATSVTFNGVPASFTVASATQITATVPAAATTGPVRVVAPGGPVTSSQVFTVVGSFAVSSLLPTRNQGQVPLASPVSVTFNQGVSGSAASLRALGVHSQSAGGYRGGTASVSGNTLTFVPAAPFKPGETLTATLSRQAQSAGGSTVVAGQVYQFTAAAGAASGNFPPLTQVATVGANPLQAMAADMNGDGHLDLVTLNVGASNFSIRLNNGSGGFSGTTNVSVISRPFASAIADVDNDGDLDLLSATDGSGSRLVMVRLNNGQGTAFVQAPNVPLSNGAYDLVAADLNADGYPDLLVTNQYTSLVSLRLNNGAGGFLNSGEIDLGTSQQPLVNPTGIAVADVDLDGDLDFITTNSNPNSLSVRLNNGGGIFSGNYLLALPAGGINVRTGDVNGDGVQDALIGYKYPDNRVQVLLGNGTGGFTLGPVATVGVNPRTFALGDIDGDGDLDLVTANADVYSLSVCFNNGSGQFTTAATLSTGQNPMGVTLADLDGDSDLDLLMGSYTDGTASISLNPGRPTATRGGALAARVALYPNPAHRRFSLTLPPQPTAQPLTLTLRNSLGQLVRTQTLRLPAAGATIEFDASGLAPGVYSLAGQLGPETFTKAVVLE